METTIGDNIGTTIGIHPLRTRQRMACVLHPGMPSPGVENFEGFAQHR